MTKRVEFGIRLPVAGPLASPDAIRRIANRGESLNYDCLWVHDFIPWTKLQDRTHVSCASLEVVEEADAPPQFFESLTNLAFLAGITENIRIGVAVLCLPFRNPIIAAKQVANVDVLSKGRMILGIGVGAPKSTHNVDFEVLNVSRKDKYPRTKDYFKAMRTIWTEEYPSYEGEFISFPETEINPKPVQKPHPPVWVGGGGPNSVDITAELATGWLPPFIAPEEYPARIDGLKEKAAEYGRGDVDFDIGTEVYVSVAQTSEKAMSQAAHTLSTLTEGFADHPDDDAIMAAGLIGTPEQISEKLRKYVDNGVLNYEMKFIYQSLDHYEEQLALFAEGVTPNFR